MTGSGDCPRLGRWRVGPKDLKRSNWYGRPENTVATARNHPRRHDRGEQFLRRLRATAILNQSLRFSFSGRARHSRWLDSRHYRYVRNAHRCSDRSTASPHFSLSKYNAGGKVAGTKCRVIEREEFRPGGTIETSVRDIQGEVSGTER